MRKFPTLALLAFLAALLLFWPREAEKAVSQPETAQQPVSKQKAVKLSAPTKAFTAWFSEYSSVQIGRAHV
jgi:hypothetical protein